ncbi:hypothetical protein [Parabacteroides sp. AF48-14]|nr:hypothetical protein [Parabacteroides sp. AF48-14]
MDTAIKKVELSIPEADMALLKLLAKKLGWNIKVIKEPSTPRKTLPSDKK